MTTVELVQFTGCPNADRARENLRVALSSAGCPVQWTEWDLGNPDTPERVRGYGSPTVLVDGADVTGAPPQGTGMSCRADGAPPADLILRVLTGRSA